MDTINCEMQELKKKVNEIDDSVYTLIESDGTNYCKMQELKQEVCDIGKSVDELIELNETNGLKFHEFLSEYEFSDDRESYLKFTKKMDFYDYGYYSYESENNFRTRKLLEMNILLMKKNIKQKKKINEMEGKMNEMQNNLDKIISRMRFTSTKSSRNVSETDNE